ncbi:MAG TPA: ergothioneine biosynthesis glutamate--cysteine ligase EgtA [Streptosporangiaceae bacterium]|nr:ergothioneine biosynthesis glutamate--cysteine ligase EgtA [Streptosporangiaceae bacterium]
MCFKTGPPGVVGAELEWLVGDAVDPSSPVPFERVRDILDRLKRPGAMPRAGLLTLEPGGQVELSTAPADDVAGCVAAASDDMAVLHEAFGAEGLTLTGHGLDLHRSPSRVLDLPRYAAMEEFFDRRGPWGRVMMCSTASVQVCVDAGLDDDTTSGFSFRWRLMHALGPVLVAAFANSPLRRGRPTGWKCTRQLVWSRLDPYRTRAPIGAEPCASGSAQDRQDPRQDMVRYAMDAEVLCLRRPDGQPWTVPTGLTFRQWLRGSGQIDTGPPTADDLSYHLSTLFPPVRARGHFELRMIDAQPGDGWIVPVALVAALADDPTAADAAMAAAEPVWYELGAAGVPPPRGTPGSTSAHLNGGAGPWLRAARLGPSDPVLGKAVTECFAAADAALARSGVAEPIRGAVADFADRYPSRGRCPADDILDTIGIRKGQS